MREFINLFQPSDQQHKFEFQTSTDTLGIIKDAFRLETFICIGATAQILLILIFPLRVAIAPALMYLIYHVLNTSLQTAKILPNQYEKDVIHSKISAQFPERTNGRFGSTPAAQPVVVFLLGVRFNHPLGLFSPGAKEIADYFMAMNKDICKHADEFGMLGVSTWKGGQDATNNSILNIYYFRDAEGINRFAHSEVHRKGWDWYNRTKYPHLGIMHESFGVPAGAYESVYKNMAPMLMSATTVKVDNEETGKEQWMRPVVSAEKGALKTSFGRMGKSSGLEHEKYDFAREGAV